MPSGEQLSEGLRWRTLTEDFSHIPEFDRPPPVICETIRVGNRLHFDRSPTRPPIPQLYPGRDIRELCGIGRGPCAVLFNGPLPSPALLRQIKVPTIGMNRTHIGYPTWEGPQPDYLCFIDTAWANSPTFIAHPQIVNGSIDYRQIGWRMTGSFRMAPFSFDLWRDGFVPTTTGHQALQLAVWMGFTEIHCLGLYLGGPHYDGTPSGGNMSEQHRLLILALPLLKARKVHLYLCASPDSPLLLLPHSQLSAVL